MNQNWALKEQRRGKENHPERGRRKPVVLNQLNDRGGEQEGRRKSGHKHLHLQDHLARGESSQDSMQSGPCSVAAEVINAGPRKARRL